jgi:hypothetical protein
LQSIGYTIEYVASNHTQAWTVARD